MDYQKQAKDFLKENGMTLKIEKCIPQKHPSWCNNSEDHGVNYWITIARNKRPSNDLGFDFWGSINDKKKCKKPTAYDILACIAMDSQTPETFEEFCADFGYDEDSRNAYAQWIKCDKFATRLRGFFTPDELDRLQEIQ